MQTQIIQNKIFNVRDQRVVLDFHLAGLYDVETKALNQAVKRNLLRFPKKFMFRLLKVEWKSMRSQFVTASQSKRNVNTTPYAFTEHGVTMLASVLKSKKAIRMNIAIVEAFVALKDLALNYKELTEKIRRLEKKYNRKFGSVNEALNVLINEKLNRDNWKRRKRIGFRRSK